MADIAYVGGSLVPIGGHNLLEPAALGIPSITGPHYFNFKEIVALLHAGRAVTIVQNEIELSQQVLEFCAKPALRMQKGAQALNVFTQNSGALQKLLAIIE
jgi:3-deoxy-D-manno-octulosonic-acid transferase